jgi:hypothetical protein
VVLTACAALPADSAAKRKKLPKLGFQLPSPGHVTILAGKVKIRTRRPKKFARHVRVAFRKKRKLPSDTRVVWATRAIRKKRSVTYAVLAIAIRKAKPGSTGSAHASDKPDLVELILHPSGHCDDCGKWKVNRLEGFRQDVCPDCAQFRAMNATFKAAMKRDADEALPPKDLLKLTEDNFTKKGDSDKVLDGKHVDTGNYDDGHTFGWHVKGKTETAQLEHHVVDDLLKGQQAQLVPAIEAHAGVDLNGDGSTRDPRCRAGSSTLFGQQTIMTPPHGTVATYYFIPFSPIPRWTYYWVHYGIKNGGCNIEDGSLQVNLEVRNPSGGAIAWDYAFPPYPSTKDGPRPFHQGDYCPGTETPKPRNHCTIGGLVLGVPPEEEGHFGGWPQPPGRDEYYWFIFAVGERDTPNQAAVRGFVSWRPAPK